MALNEFSETRNGLLNKEYSGTGAPPATGSGATFYVGDRYYKTDAASGGAYLYIYTSTGWKSAGNLA